VVDLSKETPDGLGVDCSVRAGLSARDGRHGRRRLARRQAAVVALRRQGRAAAAGDDVSLSGQADVTDRERPAPPLPLRLLGQAISLGVARAPAVWPVLRGPTRRFWERSAGTWDERIDPD